MKIDIEQEVKRFFKNKTKALITLNARIKDLGIDSLDLMEFVVKIETKYNIRFTDSELLNLETIKDLINLLTKKSLGV